MTLEDDAQDFRIEHDTMGEVRVPASARWGAQTQRAVENFPISGRPLDPAMVSALARIKGAAAEVNADLGIIDADVAAAIAAAADDVRLGHWNEHFPIDVFQTGSGTSTNMNANEVLASLATERLGAGGDGDGGRTVHPNDHVNASQSSNDVFPSAIHLAAAHHVQEGLWPALEYLAAALTAKSIELADVVKSGRTHLMDATPVTLGQELGGYAAQVRQAAERVRSTLPHVGELPLGGTAVGTGLNCPPGFAEAVIEKLAHRTGLPLREAPDHFAAQGARDALVELSGQLRGVAVVLLKIANDLRWMASGPRTGLAEIRLPDLQPGSSIMPGKVNPVIPEAVSQVCAQVIGNDATVAFAGSQGNFELNVYMPVMAQNLLESIRLLGSVSRLFADRCIAGVEADVERCRAYAESSPSLGTSLNPHIGYEAAAEIVKESVRTGRSVREIVRERGLLTDEQLDQALDVLGMTKGGVR
ncbi:MAG TPA: class II fumarate hydratase [Acidimicrobiales bacterium]|nr:class II fumarate hydratase [Acidimicrobiales bacterium]